MDMEASVSLNGFAVLWFPRADPKREPHDSTHFWSLTMVHMAPPRQHFTMKHTEMGEESCQKHPLCPPVLPLSHPLTIHPFR